jgi:dipeptidyl aminopeptidase/acylaminoacyl peptidase
MLFTTPTVAVLDLRRGDLRWLTDARVPAAGDVALVEPELIRYPGGAGHEVPAYVYRPAGYRRMGVVLVGRSDGGFATLSCISRRADLD